MIITIVIFFKYITIDKGMENQDSCMRFLIVIYSLFHMKYTCIHLLTVYILFFSFSCSRYHYHEEEDDLSEVTSDEVPEQVRHWLTSTFSRQSTKSRLGDEKPRFRSIVQALRTGLFIDR